MKSPSSFLPDAAVAPRAFYIIDPIRVVRYLANLGVFVANEESIADKEAVAASAKHAGKKEHSAQVSFGTLTYGRKESETVEDSKSRGREVTRVLRRTSFIEDSAQLLQDLLRETTWTLDLTPRIRQLTRDWLAVVRQFEVQCVRFAFEQPPEFIQGAHQHVERLAFEEFQRLLREPPEVLILDLLDTAVAELGEDGEILQLTGTARISPDSLDSFPTIDCCGVTATFKKKYLTEDGDLLWRAGKSISGQLIGEPLGGLAISEDGTERHLEVRPIVLARIRL